MASTHRMGGKVARVFPDKGFGFIAGDDHKQYFFHRSTAPEFDELAEGYLVTFVIGTPNAKGPRAEHVSRNDGR